MPNEKITFSRGPSTSMPTELIPGQFLVQTDTGNMFLDNTTDPSTGRVQIKDSTKVPLDGSVAMTGALNVGNNKVINLATPTENTDAVNKAYVDIEFQALESEFASTIAGYLPLKGGTMDGDIVVPEDNKITLNNTPVADTDAVNKSYVDSTINNAVGDITDFGIDSNGGTGYTSLTALQEAHPTGEVGIFYLVTSSDPSTNNAFDEYFWVPDSSGTSGSYEYAGTFGTVDTSTLATKAELQDGLANKLNVNGQSVTGNFEVTASGNIGLNTGNSDFSMASNYVQISLNSGATVDIGNIGAASNAGQGIVLNGTGTTGVAQLNLNGTGAYISTTQYLSLKSDLSTNIIANGYITIKAEPSQAAGAGSSLYLSPGSTQISKFTSSSSGFRICGSGDIARIESTDTVSMTLGLNASTGSTNDAFNTSVSPGYIKFSAAGGIYCGTYGSGNGLNATQCGFVSVPTPSTTVSTKAVNVQYLLDNFGSTTGIDDGVVGS